MKLVLALAAGAALMPQTAAAQSCASYVGQVVAPKDIDDVMAPFRAVGEKGEFESTDQYNARKAAAVAKLGAALIVKKVPEDRKYIVYDADSQQLNVLSYAFRNTPLSTEVLFGYGAPYEGVMKAGYLNIEVVFKSEETETGRYSGSNAYGAKADVRQIVRHSRAIFESQTSYGQDNLFPAAQNEQNVAGSIAMSPERAMQLKPLIQLAIVAVPKAPYFLHATEGSTNRATIQNPREVKNEVSALIADIQCGLVLDPANIVLGAFQTR